MRVASRFELFVAGRYLRAKRKQAVISVITVISVVGVAAGVMALIIALAINTGFSHTLQQNLLGATAHVTILEKQPGNGIEDWERLIPRLRSIPHVILASPGLYGNVFYSGPQQAAGGILKGIPIGSQQAAADVLKHLKAGSLARIGAASTPPGIILGSGLAQSVGMLPDAVLTVISPQGEISGPIVRPAYFKFRVVGIFESGFSLLDSNWAFTSLQSAQKVLALGDVVNSIELKLDDPNLASEVASAADKIIGSKLTATTWMEQNRQLRNAFRMERIVTVITIGLIELVAALNILITLVMMVMEKYRDIAVLMSMGAKRAQVRKIFLYQGLLIGVVGAAIGLIAGYGISFLAGHYRWLRLDEEVYSLSYVPFEPQWTDGLWVAAAAILVSFVATLYPAWSATRIAPAEALRYE
jgi:lipoprotein-releasing system permease protein